MTCALLYVPFPSEKADFSWEGEGEGESPGGRLGFFSSLPFSSLLLWFLPPLSIYILPALPAVTMHYYSLFAHTGLQDILSFILSSLLLTHHHIYIYIHPALLLTHYYIWLELEWEWCDLLELCCFPYEHTTQHTLHTHRISLHMDTSIYRWIWDRLISELLLGGLPSRTLSLPSPAHAIYVPLLSPFLPSYILLLYIPCLSLFSCLYFTLCLYIQFRLGSSHTHHAFAFLPHLAFYFLPFAFSHHALPHYVLYSWRDTHGSACTPSLPVSSVSACSPLTSLFLSLLPFLSALPCSYLTLHTHGLFLHG